MNFSSLIVGQGVFLGDKDMNNNHFEGYFNKVYSFPTDIEPIIYDNFLILVSPQNANWIVLDNQEQIDIVKLLVTGETIGDIYNKKYSVSNLCYVIREIEGKHFCERMVNSEDDFSLRIYLTNRCNLRCNHCFMYADKKLPDELTYDEIITIIKLSKKSGCTKVIFTGGEVCLKEKFIDILKFSHSIGLYVQVLSNGTIWNEIMIKEASPYIDEIQISIDGYNELTNAMVRGSGWFSKVMSVVELFSKENVFLSITITPLYEMIDKYREEYINFSKELIAKYGNKKFLVVIAKELIDGRNIKCDSEKNKQMTKNVNEMYEAIYENFELTTFVMNHKYNRIIKNCGFGVLTINSNGDYYFCGRINDVKSYGNIRKTDFDVILNNRIRARYKTFVDNIIPCKTCNIKYICGGGCRVDNVNEAELFIKH